MNFDQFPEQKPQENPVQNEGWISREPFEFGKDYFQLQYDFAKALQEKTGKPLFEIVKDCTSILRFNAFNYDGFDFKGIKEGVTEDNIVDMAYADYLNEEKGGPVEYHPEGSQGFGCFNYELEKDKNTAKIHFMNAEFDKVGPLDKSKIEMRKKELHDVLDDIKKKHPEVSEITGLSWLYNLPAYKRLFPQSYLDNLKIDDRRVQWLRGTTIWGQFFDSEYRLREDLTEELLRRVRELPADAPLAELFENGSPILPPLATHGPIEDFYKMYGLDSVSSEQKIDNFEKEYITNLFASNPALAEIGTQEGYLEYLTTVFSESTVKEIVWHGTVSENKIEAFDHDHEHNKKGVTFFGDLKQAKGYKDADRGDLYAAKINLINPYIQTPEDAWATDQLEKEHLDSFRDAGYDGIVGEGIFADKERIVFDPNQIHILGSTADLEKFKGYVEDNKKILDLPTVEKGLPLQEKLNQLFEAKVLDTSPEGKKYILQTLSRIAVIANVNGVKIPFYQSSTGTEGKNTDKWYPFFGSKGAWLIKGKIDDLNKGYDIPELKEMMDYLDATLPEYLSTNLLTPNQKAAFDDDTWKKGAGKVQSVKDAHPEFIINQDEAAEYMAKVLNYDLKDAPDDGSDEKSKVFIPKILDSIKKRLEIIRKF